MITRHTNNENTLRFDYTFNWLITITFPFNCNCIVYAMINYIVMLTQSSVFFIIFLSCWRFSEKLMIIFLFIWLMILNAVRGNFLSYIYLWFKRDYAMLWYISYLFYTSSNREELVKHKHFIECFSRGAEDPLVAFSCFLASISVTGFFSHIPISILNFI